MEVSTAARRARLVRRHCLDGSARSAEEATRAVLALHATDPATVYLSALARGAGLRLADVARELYDDVALVRLLGMRRTLFVVPTDHAPLVQAGATAGVARTMRRRLVKQLSTLPTDPSLPRDPDAVVAWLDTTIDATHRAARRLGVASGAQLAAAEPALRTAFLPTTDKKYDVRRTVTSPVLALMSAEGRLVRGRPLGSWTSRQHTWQAASLHAELTEAEAQTELARLYVARFGPVTELDVTWWTGWSKGVTRAALGRLQLSETSAGLVLEGDEPADDPPPEVAALLPSLDPTPMGWKERDWFLPEDSRTLYDAFGNIGPTIWWAGEVVGGWAVRPDGTVVTQLLVDRGTASARAVAEAVAALEPRLEGTAVAPSFPVPLEVRLRTA